MSTPKSVKVGSRVGYVTTDPTAERMFYGNEALRSIPDGVVVTNNPKANINGMFGRANPITREDVGYTSMNNLVTKGNGTPNTEVDITDSLTNRMTSTLGDTELFREIQRMGLSAVEVIPRASKTQVGIVIVGNNIDVDNIGTISVKTGSKDVLGLLRVGNNLNVSNGVISLSTASKSALGGVIVGDNINVDGSGKISLQKASTTAYGIVKVGSNISVSSDSTISVPVATSGVLGVVRNGANISNNNGILSVPTATNTTLGVVKAGSNITISSDGSINAANSYVHPSTHPGSMITEDSTHRWTTDSEKSRWNGMLPLSGGTMTGVITGKDVSGSWIGGKTNACIKTNVSASSYSSGITFTSTTHTFSVGSLGNGQCGIYMYNNGTTANQTDGKLYLDTSGNAYCGGTFTATGDIVGMSDRRLKKDINHIEDAMSIIRKLDGVRFTWKRTGEQSMGLIAQDVKDIIPEAVFYHKEERKWGIKYANLIGLLVNAIKELDIKVKELENK